MEGYAMNEPRIFEVEERLERVRALIEGMANLANAGDDFPGRGGGEHVRGCWALDLVLGKA